MFPSATSTTISEEASISSETRAHIGIDTLNSLVKHQPDDQPPKSKKKTSQPGNPDLEAEVVALSPKTILATNRFVCEICSKGFQRDQNLQLHRRGHNLPWRLRHRSGKEARKRVYVCPEPSCVHHQPSRALGDLTGIKKHFCRKHGEKKWECEKCSKKYAVHSDWKAHIKTCGTREYRCDCGTLFSRKDSFVTHRAFCDALAEESARLIATTTPSCAPLLHQPHHFLPYTTSWNPPPNPNPHHNCLSILNPNPNPNSTTTHAKNHQEDIIHPIFRAHLLSHPPLSPADTAFAATASLHMPATTLLQGASALGLLPPTVTAADLHRSYDAPNTGQLAACQTGADRLTRDFIGVVSRDIACEEHITSFPNSRGGHGFPPVTGAWGDYKL